MNLGVVVVVWVGVRQRVRHIDSLHGLQVMVVMVIVVDVYGTSAGPGGGGGVGRTIEHPRPGVEGARQLHSAGVVTRKRGVSSSRGFSSGLYGLCSGHISCSLIKEDRSFKILC